MARTNKPADEFRIGRIKATIWENQTKTGDVWFIVELVRLYLDGETWHESTKFGRDDLPIVAKVADMAFARIWSQVRPADSEETKSAVAPSNEIHSPTELT